MIQSLFYFIIVFFFSTSFVQADEKIVAGDFSAQGLSDGFPGDWEALHFDGVKKQSSYRHVYDEGKGSIQATSRAASSGLIRRINIDPTLYPIINFSWKIQDIIPSADMTKKNGEDAPARVYVTFAYDSAKVNLWEKVKFETSKFFYGEYPPIASLVYVWASHCEQGTIMESPYTSRVKIVVLKSGAAQKRQWVTEQRDIRADYLAAFGTDDIPMISGVAIMTDTDNTGGEAVAWYGDIIFSKPLSMVY